MYLCHGKPVRMATVQHQDEDRLSKSQMSFGEHLDELRTRLFKAIIASLCGLVLMLFFQDALMKVVVAPYQEATKALGIASTLNVFGVAQAFFSYMKVAFVVGLIATSPFWIYQIWAFVAAGLYSKERRAVTRYIPLCVFLFLAGVVFGYYAMIPLGLRYLLSYGDPTMVAPMIGLKEYLSLFTVMTLVLGLSFQLPVVMIGLARAGMVTLDGFRAKRRWAILLIFVAAAILTPPDPVTQCLLAVPLVFLFEVGIFAAWLGMGPERPPIQWRAKWPIVQKTLLVLCLAFLFRDQLYGLWVRSGIDDRVISTSISDAERANVKGMLEQLLGEPVPFAFRAGEAGQQAWILSQSASGVKVIRLVAMREDPRLARVGRSASGEPELSVTTLPAGARVYDLTVAAKVPLKELRDSIHLALNHGSDATKTGLHSLLHEWTGVDKELSSEEFLAAVEQWMDQQKDGIWHQPVAAATSTAPSSTDR